MCKLFFVRIAGVHTSLRSFAQAGGLDNFWGCRRFGEVCGCADILGH